MFQKQNRPMSQAVDRLQAKSIDNLHSLEGAALNHGSPLQRPMVPQTQRQTVQPVPLKLSNQNSPQLTLNHDYFTQPLNNNKKLVSAQSPHRPRLLEGRNQKI